MVDFANLFWLIFAAVILINVCLFILVYSRIIDKRDKSEAWRGSVAEKEATHECPHFVGYLADEHPRSKPIPKECFGCTLTLECMNKQEKEKSELAHCAREKEGWNCDECRRRYTVKCVVCGKKRCKKHADVFNIITKKKTMQLYMCLRCHNCLGYVCSKCYEEKSSFFGGITLHCKKCGQKLSIDPIPLSELGERWNEAELSKFEILEA